MNDCCSILNKSFPHINIKYYADLGVLRVKCADIIGQFEDMKKILKVLIFEIQSKIIKKDAIIIEFNNKDFLSDNIEKLLNILKFTKTSHYFNIIIKNSDEIKDRIDFIANKYVGLNINK